MTAYVVDASTAAKWVLPAAQESLRTEANLLLAGYRDGAFDLIVPDLFWSELGNVLWKAARMGRFSAAAAQAALREIQSYGLRTIPTEPLGSQALAIACAANRSFYDSLYVALAEQSQAPLITADERLANALAARWPVQWLGAIH